MNDCDVVLRKGNLAGCARNCVREYYKENNKIPNRNQLSDKMNLSLVRDSYRSKQHVENCLKNALVAFSQSKAEEYNPLFKKLGYTLFTNNYTENVLIEGPGRYREWVYDIIGSYNKIKEIEEEKAKAVELERVEKEKADIAKKELLEQQIAQHGIILENLGWKAKVDYWDEWRIYVDWLSEKPCQLETDNDGTLNLGCELGCIRTFDNIHYLFSFLFEAKAKAA
jgi:hypothetical protein